MARGSELYSELEGPEQVDRLLDGNFPATDPQNPIDKIIRNCWNGCYVRIADLVDDVREILGGVQIQQTMCLEERLGRRKACEDYYNRIRSYR